MSNEEGQESPSKDIRTFKRLGPGSGHLPCIQFGFSSLYPPGVIPDCRVIAWYDPYKTKESQGLPCLFSEDMASTHPPKGYQPSVPTADGTWVMWVYFKITKPGFEILVWGLERKCRKVGLVLHVTGAGETLVQILPPYMVSRAMPGGHS